MNGHKRNPGFWSKSRIALAILGLGAAGCAWAASTSEAFRVSVNFNPLAPSATVQCTRQTNVFGTPVQVTIRCGAPAAESSDRFLLHVYRAGEWLGQVETDMGTGTVTSWRVVHIANRDYLELTVGW